MPSTAPILAFLFESPLTALAVGAAAVGIPILIHLLNRNRYRVVTWAAMRFLLAAQKKNTRRLRLEQLALLAVRTAIVLLLVLATLSVMPWAEALWHRLLPGQPALATAGHRRTHKILVLDGSFSMATRIGEQTCFDRARAMATRILQDSPGGDGFSVLLLAAPPRRIVSEPADDPAKVADEVKNLRLPHGNADLAATFNAVKDMVAKSPEKYLEREVYFLTDLQRSTWMARANMDPHPVLKEIQKRARTFVLDVGQDGISNAAVTELSLGDSFVMAGTPTIIRATVTNYGSEAVHDRKAELWIGKARQKITDPPFALRAVQQAIVNAPAGQTVQVSFHHVFSVPGDYAVQVRLESDALDLDDVRSGIVTVKDTVPVMLVNGKPAADAYDRATEWLKDALNPFAPRAAGLNPIRPKVLSESQFADAGLGDLTRYDCVFLCDVPRLSAAEIRRLETHLRRGGGVVICLGPQADPRDYNRLLYRNGAGILPARLVGPHRHVGATYSLTADDDEFRRAPLDVFAGDNDRASLVNVRFRDYVKVEPAPRGKARTVLSFRPVVIAGSEKAITPTISSADLASVGDPALITSNWSRGRVVLFTSAVNMDWSTWPVSPTFLPFMQELLHFAVAGRLRAQAVNVGDALEEVLPIGASGLDVAMHTPEERTENARTQGRDENAVLSWTDTDASGIYRATVGREPREYLFAVNVPASTDTQQGSESDLARTNADELRSAFPDWDIEVQTDPSRVSHAQAPDDEGDGTTAAIGSGLARYCLVAMLLLLIIEVVLAWRLAHHATELRTDAPRAGGRVLAGGLVLVAGLGFLAIGAVLLHAVITGDFLGFLPETWRRAVETAFDIPPPTAGEATRWRLEYTPYFWDAGIDPWLAGAVAIAIAFAVVVIYLHEGRTSGTAYRMGLAGLRIGLVVLTLAVLLPRVQLLFERQSSPDIAILIDDSASMSHHDDYQDAEIRKAADRLAERQALTKPERLQLAQALVGGDNPDWLYTLLARHQVKVHVYHCSGRAARLADVSDAEATEQRQTALEQIKSLRAEGDSSQLGTAVRQVLDDFRGSSLAAIIMLTDGVTTEGEDLLNASHRAARAGVPLFFVGIGDAHEPRDLQLHDLQVDDSVYVHDRLIFEARLKGKGYSDLTVPVTLREKGKDEALATKMVHVDPRGNPVKFRLIHQPTEPGEKTYVISVPVPPEEGKPARTVSLERTVYVRELKLIRVLYVESSARYEFRYIKHLLERESARDPRNKTIDLKVLLLDADQEYARLDRSALAEFPGQVELNQFDVLILGDVDPNHPKLNRHLGAIVDFVRERGGGLLLIAGEEYNPSVFKNTPLRDIMPIEVIATPAQRERLATYRPELTASGRFHPIFRFSPDEGENTSIWQGLSELYWWAEGYRAKPGAEVLAVHPGRPAQGGSSSSGAQHHPLVLQEFVGAGRSLFFGFDETWRWRYREGELRFNQFWIQTVRYLARNRSARAELFLDRQTPYRRGEPIKITVRFPDDAPPLAPGIEVSVVAERRRPPADFEAESERLTLARVKDSRSTFEGTLTRTPVGDYRFWLSTPEVSGSKPRAECRVLPPPGEMDRLQMNRADMERAAQETHGRFFTLADADQIFQHLPSGTRVSLSSSQPPWRLWNHPGMFLFVLFVLTSEWFLRKRKHLL